MIRLKKNSNWAKFLSVPDKCTLNELAYSKKKILFHFQMVLKIISAQKIPCIVWTISLILLSYKLLCGVDRSKRYQYWLSVNLSVPLIF